MWSADWHSPASKTFEQVSEFALTECVWGNVESRQFARRLGSRTSSARHELARHYICRHKSSSLITQAEWRTTPHKYMSYANNFLNTRKHGDTASSAALAQKAEHPLLVQHSWSVDVATIRALVCGYWWLLDSLQYLVCFNSWLSSLLVVYRLVKDTQKWSFNMTTQILTIFDHVN